jgi:hypothetical protein
MRQLPACSRFFTHFAVTMALADPASDLLVRRLSLLRDCVALARRRSGVEIDTAAVLPAEMHLLCRLLPGEEPGPALRVIRAGFARHAGQDGPVWDSAFSIAEVPAAALGARRRFLLAAPGAGGAGARTRRLALQFAASERATAGRRRPGLGRARQNH